MAKKKNTGKTKRAIEIWGFPRRPVGSHGDMLDSVWLVRFRSPNLHTDGWSPWFRTSVSATERLSILVECPGGADAWHVTEGAEYPYRDGNNIYKIDEDRDVRVVDSSELTPLQEVIDGPDDDPDAAALAA